jgi:hypothetical protein
MYQSSTAVNARLAAGAHPKNPLHTCYKKNSNRHSLPQNQRKNSCRHASNKVCTQITPTPWPPSATSTAAVHAPPPPSPTCRTRAPHPWQRNVRFNFFISSGGRQMNYCSALSRNNTNPPPYTTINRLLVMPAMSLPRPRRCLEPARLILGDAASARIGSIRPMWGVVHIVSSSSEIRRKRPPTQQSIGVLSCWPCPSPGRSDASKPRAASWATRRLIELVQFKGWGAYNIVFHPRAK